MRLLLVALLACAGCAAPPRPPSSPDTIVVVFADGFHSGLVLSRSDMPQELLPPGSDRPWVTVHFGEWSWISGEASGTLDALRLAVIPGAGGVQVDAIDWWVHERGGTEPAQVRVWAFPVSATELAGLQQRLRAWIAPGAAHPIRPDSCWWPSRRAWSLRTNCHDFTVDLLAAADIRVDRPPIMMAAPLRAALDRAWMEREQDR